MPAQQTGFIYVNNGRLYHPDGREVALYGVNLQPCLSWEYNARMQKAGLAKNAVLWKKMTDKSLDELALMRSNYIRVHLTPADFTDANGNLVQTPLSKISIPNRFLLVREFMSLYYREMKVFQENNL